MMRMTARAAIICALLSGGAAHAEGDDPADKLFNIYALYQVASRCLDKDLSFDAKSVAKVAVAIKEYANASGLSQEARDEQWERSKTYPNSITIGDEWCKSTRDSLGKLFPGVLPKISDNPF
jgi:hypothetical protein